MKLHDVAFGAGYFPAAQRLGGPSALLPAPICSFSSSGNCPQHGTPILSSIQQLMDFWGVSPSFWLLGITLLGTLTFESWRGHTFHLSRMDTQEWDCWVICHADASLSKKLPS